jgi:hypothetical protein
MLTGISASNAVNHAPQAAPPSQNSPAASSSVSSHSIQDTVSLSPAAQQPSKAGGDVDHDGDSH